MPELPEVETVCRQLDPEVAGQTVLELEVLDEMWASPGDPVRLADAVAGRTLEGIDRRGKYLLLRLDRGETVVIHLRMTGNLILVDPEQEMPLPGDPRIYRPSRDERHLRARFRLGDGRALWFTDPRRFGRGFLSDEPGLQAYFATRLGAEPFSAEFTPKYLERVSQGRTAPLKSFLLDQTRLAGVGNIYADEALFRARLHPLSPAGSMRAAHCQALRNAVVESLQAGLDNGGASIDDYRDSRGEQGSMQNEFLVHRRQGEPCPECGTEIQRIVVSGRSTYFCPVCQKRLRRRTRSRKSTSRI